MNLSGGETRAIFHERIEAWRTAMRYVFENTTGGATDDLKKALDYADIKAAAVLDALGDISATKHNVLKEWLNLPNNSEVVS